MAFNQRSDAIGRESEEPECDLQGLWSQRSIYLQVPRAGQAHRSEHRDRRRRHVHAPLPRVFQREDTIAKRDAET